MERPIARTIVLWSSAEPMDPKAAVTLPKNRLNAWIMHKIRVLRNTERFAHFIIFSDVEPPQWSAEVRRIGALRDSRFWAAQNSASRKILDSIALFCVIFA